MLPGSGYISNSAVLCKKACRQFATTSLISMLLIVTLSSMLFMQETAEDQPTRIGRVLEEHDHPAALRDDLGSRMDTRAGRGNIRW